MSEPQCRRCIPTNLGRRMLNRKRRLKSRFQNQRQWQEISIRVGNSCGFYVDLPSSPCQTGDSLIGCQT